MSKILTFENCINEALALAERCKEASVAGKTLLRQLPSLNTGEGLYYAPETDRYWIQAEDPVIRKKCAEVLPRLCGPANYTPGSYPYDLGWIKIATSPTVQAVGQTMNMLPGHTLGIPNNPSPLTSMLTSGVLGAGLGYGLGYLGERMLPATWHKNKLRKTLAMLGGIGGAMPGLAWGGMNAAMGKDFNDSSLVKDGGYSPTGAYLPPIDVNSANQIIWQRPNGLTIPEQAATSGLIVGAAHLASSEPGSRLYVTPGDIGRLAVGMGSGYFAGSLVGRGLGVLFGMPESTQEQLRSVGLFAGAIRALLPLAYR